MKNILFILVYLSISFTVNCYAQTRYYCYDAAGNRIAKNTASTYCGSIGGIGKTEGDELIQEEMASHTDPGTIFPNPNTGIFTIDFVEDIPSRRIYLYDLNGKLLKEENISGIHKQVEMHDIPSGTYLLILRDESGRQIWDWKVIKL